MADKDKIENYDEIYGVGCDSKKPGCTGTLGVAKLTRHPNGTFTITPPPPAQPETSETSAKLETEISKDVFDSYEDAELKAKYIEKVVGDPTQGYKLRGGKRRSRKRRSSKKKRKNKKSKKSRKAKKSRKSRK